MSTFLGARMFLCDSIYACFITVAVSVQELVLYPNSNGCMEDLLKEARKHITLDPAGSGKLR